MIFVDASVLGCAIGVAGDARDEAQEFFLRSLDQAIPLVTSAMSLLEITAALDTAERCARGDHLMKLVRGRMCDVWPLEAEDLYHAERLQFRFPDLHQSGLVVLAACWRRGVHEIHTFDDILRRAARAGPRGTRLTGRDRARMAQQAWRERKWRER